MRKINFLLLFIILIIIYNCEDFSTGPRDINLIFPYAEFISLINPADSSAVSTPIIFKWKKTSQQLVFIGVFSHSIITRSGKILNTQDNIWAWHTGIENADEGTVAYSQGFNVVNGNIQTDKPPTPLESRDECYYWAVWAWDNAGGKITHSSQQYCFFVK